MSETKTGPVQGGTGGQKDVEERSEWSDWDASRWSHSVPRPGNEPLQCLHQIARQVFRPSQQGAAVVLSSSARRASSLKLASIFLISFQPFRASQELAIFAFPLCSCLLPLAPYGILATCQTLPPLPRLPTSHARSDRNIDQSLLAGRLHPLRASSPGVPDATMHATVHTHHLGNSSSTQPRPTSPSAHYPPLDARSLETVIKRAACTRRAVGEMTRSHMPK